MSAVYAPLGYRVVVFFLPRPPEALRVGSAAGAAFDVIEYGEEIFGADGGVVGVGVAASFPDLL